MNKSLEPLVPSKKKPTLMPLSQRLLGIAVHLAHAAWMIALVLSVANNGAIQSYVVFMPILVLACLLEMWRWALLGNWAVEIKGAYSYASEVEAANRDFLLFSWYVVPPVPPFNLIERYACSITESTVKKTQGQIFARFWLKSEVTLVVTVVCLAFFLFPLDSPPLLWGLGKFFPIICLFWIVEFGLVSKLISVFIYSILVRVFKGF